MPEIWLRDPKATATVFILRLRLDGNALSKCRSGLQRVARVGAHEHSSAELLRPSWNLQDEMGIRHVGTLLGMYETTRRVLQLFIEMGADSLDLHTLFEAGGNDPEQSV